jgi:ABC-2 type transport system permease protein
MSKYRHVLAIGLQNNLTYRFNFLARALFGLIPLIALLYVWHTIYGQKEADATIGTYTLTQMISYYLLITIVDALTAVNEDDWQIATDIKDGAISQFILKPIDYLRYRLMLFLAGRIAYLGVAIVPLAVFIFALRKHFILPEDPVTLLLFVVSIFLTALLQFFISYTLAMLAFWVLEVSTFIFVMFAFEYIASGHLFPLDLLPGPIQNLLFLTPFPYQLYFPISVYMGKVQGPELLKGLLTQAAWVVAAYLCARLAWRKGIQRYSAVGG